LAKRSYGQLCAVARALDVLGERWTLLVVRELLFGPRRFGELLEVLPGIGPNLLSMRLKALGEGGVAKRVALPRAGGVGYELTDAGRALDDVLLALARWELVERPRPPTGVIGDASPRWSILALRARFRGGAGTGAGEAGQGESYQLEVEDESFVLRADGALSATAGRDPAAAVVLRTDAGTLARLALGAVGLETAVADGQVELRGSPFAVTRMARHLALEGASDVGPGG
jgi:DNA-binding HxlR family transcriptional regulator